MNPLPNSDLFRIAEGSPERFATSPFQVIVGVVVPVGIAAIAAARTAGAEFWGLIALGFFVGSLVLVRPLVVGWQHMRQQRSDRRWVLGHLTELGELTDLFGRLTDEQYSDTLYHIVTREVSRRDHNAVDKLHLLPHDVVTNTLKHLQARVEKLDGRVASYISTLEEFDTIVHHYIRYYVQPVYAKLPDMDNITLEPRVRGELEAFRERFNIFQDRLDQLRRSASTTLQTVDVHTLYYQRIKPLGMH